MTYTCGESESNTDEPDMGCTYNDSENEVSAAGKLPLKQWVDLNLIAQFNLID
jgi:hypothetical protein